MIKEQQIVSELLISFIPAEVLYSGDLVLNQVFRITESFGISTFICDLK
ncbi:hypothetical protein AB1L06_05710 [Bacillus mojavensis]